jgi:hypothetical protein
VLAADARDAAGVQLLRQRQRRRPVLEIGAHLERRQRPAAAQEEVLGGAVVPLQKHHHVRRQQLPVLSPAQRLQAQHLRVGLARQEGA